MAVRKQGFQYMFVKDIVIEPKCKRNNNQNKHKGRPTVKSRMFECSICFEDKPRDSVHFINCKKQTISGRPKACTNTICEMCAEKCEKMTTNPNKTCPFCKSHSIEKKVSSIRKKKLPFKLREKRRMLKTLIKLKRDIHEYRQEYYALREKYIEKYSKST